MENEAEVFVEVGIGEWFCGCGEVGVLIDPGAVGGEFAGAEVGLVEMASASGAALELPEMFADVFVRGEFGPVFFKSWVTDANGGFNTVGDIAEEEGGALLAF